MRERLRARKIDPNLLTYLRDTTSPLAGPVAPLRGRPGREGEAPAEPAPKPARPGPALKEPRPPGGGCAAPPAWRRRSAFARVRRSRPPVTETARWRAS